MADTQIHPNTWFLVLNNTDFVIPPYGAMTIQGFDSDGNIIVGAPDFIGQTDLLFNGPTEIEPDGIGQGTRTFPLIAAYDLGEDAPIGGEIWGVGAGSFYLQRSKPGFKIVGDGSTGWVSIVPMSQQLVSFIKITSLVKVDGRYPAIEMNYDPVLKVWTEGDVCWWVDAND